MPDPFEDRLREAVVIPAESQLGPLREATKAASGSLGSGEGLDLVRAAYRRDLQPEREERLRTRLNSKQQVIATRGEMQLFGTLSAITLIHVLARPKYAPGLLPALAVRAARSAGWLPVHADVQSYSDFYLRERAAQVRLPVSEAEFQHVPKDDEAFELSTDVRNLRSALFRERDLQRESNQLHWWLQSEDRPRSALAAALEFARLVDFLPEPIATLEFLRAKLTRPDAKRFLAATEPPVPEIPPELSDFCSALLAADLSGEESPEVERAHVLLNEILLIRALEERPIER